jgi:hypothetical protein
MKTASRISGALASSTAATNWWAVRISGRSTTNDAMWMASSLPKSRLTDVRRSCGREARASVNQRRSAAGRSSVDPASSERLNTKSKTGRTSHSMGKPVPPVKSRTAGRWASGGRSTVRRMAGRADIVVIS